MITVTTPTDPLVEVLATRLRVLDLMGWQRVAAWAEQADLSFEDLRLLIALAVKRDDGPTAISELAELAGFSVEKAYPVTHRLRGRGYLYEERRLYALSPEGLDLVAKLDASHREGIEAYVAQLDPDEIPRLDAAFGIER
jgi:DNA-binding MarR family transcriptional regulator